ncbi:ran-binding protein 9-like [Daphnia carinata]|uniref:ran-binding protein 9-like n=1 Tax=Daphnia carinata TaxID=120202 RepID=UPI00257DF504|nr:ran-binding protein 9-like [Daphnia carinata]
MDNSSSSCGSAPSNSSDRLKMLYPFVNEEDTPLPRCWSSKDKYNFIGLSQNNLRVHYKGYGKTHKDAASVRATHPIPSACGLYYFEVKIVSKGRDGYMGIGLSAQGVNMNRLPGWDKHSYGYHGDDGHSFCSSGSGQPYGPTFTTSDVIGCGVNLIDNTCFYTKNGHNLGTAFADLPSNLYPTVGLQTPGEIVDTNFGQSPFVYDIEDDMRELRARVASTILNYPIPDKQGHWEASLQRMIATYLVHHGYCATAEAFARSTGQEFGEEVASIKNRQRIQRLVLSGRMGEAIETTQTLYPTLLDSRPNLLFLLKVRQFIEMVGGSDSEVRSTTGRSPKSQNSGSPNMSPNYGGFGTSQGAHPSLRSRSRSRSSSPGHSSVQTSVIQSTKAFSQHLNGSSAAAPLSSDMKEETDEDVEMNGASQNGSHAVTGETSTYSGVKNESLLEMEVDVAGPSTCTRRQLCGGNQLAMERTLEFGKELQALSVTLRRQHGKNEANKKMLRDAFSLLAYADPWKSPVCEQLDPVQREPVCAALNSAIMESHHLPRRPPMELAIGHARELLRLMAQNGLGSCAFANIDHLLQP